MSPVFCVLLLAISASQVLSDSPSTEYADIMDVLISVNKTVNKLYDIMATQKDRDIELVEAKMKETYQQLRTKRDTASTENSEALDKIQDAFKDLREGLSSFVKNVTSSDIYKSVQKIGEDIQTKGKEIGSKIEETIKNARKDSDEKNN